jgi:hypothetical protein
MEDVIYSQVAQLEAALSTERKERSSLLESQNGMHQKMPEPQLSSDIENALRVQVGFIVRKYNPQIIDLIYICSKFL